MSDERNNLPSASGIHRLASCAGSFRMCQGLPDSPTAESEFGTRVHEFLAGRMAYEDTTPEEFDIAESCLAIEAEVVKQWMLRNQIPDDAEIITTRDSERMWLEFDGEKVCSGLADVIHRYERHALILDFKTFAGAHGEATENLQLRCLAVLAMHTYGWLKAADVAIIQPLVTHSPMVCHYDVDGLIQAQLELRGILEAARQPNAPLHAGEQCKYCRAASICPEVRKEVETLSALTINESGLTVPDEDMARLLNKCGMARKMIESIKAECFRRCEADPATWRSYGYEIKEGAGRRSVEDVATVSERLHEKGASWEDITAACSITIGDVEALMRKATGLKGMGLKAEAAKIMQDCVIIKIAKPSLRRINDADEE